jgi:hypothetical protein
LGVADPACQCVEHVVGILLLVSCWREELKRRIDPSPSEAEESKTGRGSSHCASRQEWRERLGELRWWRR